MRKIEGHKDTQKKRHKKADGTNRKQNSKIIYT